MTETNGSDTAGRLRVGEAEMPGEEFALYGAEGLPVYGTTVMPEGEAVGVAVVVHGWTGHRDRNVVPVAAMLAREAGLIAHRITLGHAGVADGEDEITHLDEFAKDRVDFAMEDVKGVLGLMDKGTIPGAGLPLVLIGHSRGGSQVIRMASFAARESWVMQPAGLIALAPPSAHTRFPEFEQEELATTGYVERDVARAAGGKVRMSPTWFAHRFDEAGNFSPTDVFAEDCAGVACPALVVHAGDDDAVGPEHAERIRLLFSRHEEGLFTAATVDGADHNFSARGVFWEGVTYDGGTVDALRGVMAPFVARLVAASEAETDEEPGAAEELA